VVLGAGVVFRRPLRRVTQTAAIRHAADFGSPPLHFSLLDPPSDPAYTADAPDGHSTWRADPPLLRIRLNPLGDSILIGNGSSRRVAEAVLCAALLVVSVPAAADPGIETDIPAGDIQPSDADDIFDDAFELELARSSDMQRLDPFEETNRKMFAFNELVIDFVFDPIMIGYRFVMPDFARRGLRMAFQNLDAPRILTNDLLQLRFRAAGETLGRFVLNTAFGFGGLFDVGEAAGWERHDADFGQTLGRFGVGSGPFLMVPVFGPTTVRDGLGSIIDLAFQPLAYILGPAEIMLQIYIGGGNGLTVIDANRDKLQALEESSIDYYAALRSAYLQSRRAAVARVRGESEPGMQAEPDPIVAEPSVDVDAGASQVRVDSSLD